MSDGNTIFLRAARDGNLQEVLEYLKGSTDINTSNPNGLNALHLASKEGHLNIVTELLRRGANVEAATKKGNTALHIASLAGHGDIVRLLVENGAKVNIQAQMGFTPLYMASQEGHAEVVKYLLANGASQTLATADGFTPLAVALQQGHEKVVTVLLEHDTKGKLRLPALHIAAKKDDTKSAALLLQNEQSSLNTTTEQTQSGSLVNDTTKSGFTPLHIASHYGNVNVGSLLIQRGADVNYKAKNNITPLHVASRWGKPQMVTLLLDNRAIIDEKTRDGLTPLHCASRSGHENTVDLLLERGAPYSARTKNGLTPIHMAAQGDHVDCVRLLLYHRAPVDDVTMDYLTPLHVAAHCGNVKTAKLLLDRKCEPNARALNGFTPLHIACKKNRIKVVELLLKYGASIEATTESGLTPLHVASFMGHMNIVIYLIQNNANPDFPTVRGETALHLAARANQTDIIRILLRNGASVDARAREQQTPLHIAARLGNVDNVTLLLHHGASPDAVTKDLYTPLHIAAKEGHEEVASVLLDNGASHGLTTKKGFTPLHIAAKYGNIKVARLLLQKEANPDVQGKNGLTPLHVATHYNHVNVALLLLDHKASPHCVAKNGYTPLHIAAKKNQMDIATTLLEFGAKPDAESKNGFTPLHLAAQEGHTDMVSLLLEHKASVSSKAHNGLTPMHLAAQEDKVNIAEVLVKYGAEIDPQTKAGYTPLHTACHFGQINMVRFLLDHGASVSSTTKLGYTPLHQAAQQGHVQVVNLLLKNKASPNAVTNNGQTALSIAQRLGYISVVDTLSVVTEVTETPPEAEVKYKVVSPETMQETLLSDSEDEGGDDFLPQSPLFGKPLSEQIVYLPYYEGSKMQSREDSISLERGESTSPLDTSYNEKDYMETQLITQSFASYSSSAPDRPATTTAAPGKAEGGYSSYSGSSFGTNFEADNVAIDRTPVYSGFLISFMVDARGGAMRGRRHSGVRIIIPPRKASMPTRVTCRLIKKEKLMHPLPLNEGEALAARILEMGPVGTKFLGRIVIEVPHFASLRGKERAIKILRSDNGEKWEEHPIVATDEAVNKALNASLEDLDQDDELTGKRVTRILTDDFPRYFAIVTKIREESNTVGEDGGVISSTVVPQVQAVFPEGALTKKIKVGLQAQPINPEVVAKLLGNRVAVSPIVTLEPRRRKFHKYITLTIPVPRAAQKGMINPYDSESPTLRVLYSISEGTTNTVWDDLTDQTQLEFVDDCVSFTTRVSGRFWLMDCQDVAKSIPMATQLYKEAITVPYMARFVVFAKRTGEEEGKLRMFCMTDDKIDKTLEKQEHFVEVARSRDVEVLEGRPQFVEMAGNLIPVTKSGDQLYINFKAFRENRLPCTVRIRDMDQEPAARVAFMKEPKVGRGEVPQTPICNLNISLPDMSTSSSMEMDGDAALELRKRSSVLKEHGIVMEDTVSRAQIKLTDVADTLKGDWVMLAQQLDINSTEINQINTNYKTVNDQALAMLQFWVDTNKEQATGNALETALIRINREDVVKKCMYNVQTVEDEVEAAAARVAMDQSGFDTFTEEVGISQEVPVKRGTSLDVEFDEQDIVKESESAAEESQPSSEGGSMVEKQAPQAIEEDGEPSHVVDDHQFIAEVSERRPVAKTEYKPEKRDEDFFDLINQLDKYSDIKEAQAKSDRPEEVDDKPSITEDEIRHMKQDRAKVDEVLAKVEQFDQKSAPPITREETEEEKETYEDEEGSRTPPPSPVDQSQTTEEKQQELTKEVIEKTEQVLEGKDDEEEYEETTEEIEQSFTEIEEIYQESSDGKTWRTVRKVTTITPQGTSERFEILKEERMAAVTELAARLSKSEEEEEQQEFEADETAIEKSEESDKRRSVTEIIKMFEKESSVDKSDSEMQEQDQTSVYKSFDEQQVPSEFRSEDEIIIAEKEVIPDKEKTEPVIVDKSEISNKDEGVEEDFLLSETCEKSRTRPLIEMFEQRAMSVDSGVKQAQLESEKVEHKVTVTKTLDDFTTIKETQKTVIEQQVDESTIERKQDKEQIEYKTTETRVLDDFTTVKSVEKTFVEDSYDKIQGKSPTEKDETFVTEKPDMLLVDEHKAPVIESISPVAHIVEDIESHVYKIEDEIKEEKEKESVLYQEKYQEQESKETELAPQGAEKEADKLDMIDTMMEEDEEDDWEVVDREEIEEYDVPYSLPSPQTEHTVSQIVSSEKMFSEKEVREQYEQDRSFTEEKELKIEQEAMPSDHEIEEAQSSEEEDTIEIAEKLSEGSEIESPVEFEEQDDTAEKLDEEFLLESQTEKVEKPEKPVSKIIDTEAWYREKIREKVTEEKYLSEETKEVLEETTIGVKSSTVEQVDIVEKAEESEKPEQVLELETVEHQKKLEVKFDEEMEIVEKSEETLEEFEAKTEEVKEEHETKTVDTDEMVKEFEIKTDEAVDKIYKETVETEQMLEEELKEEKRAEVETEEEKDEIIPDKFEIEIEEDQTMEEVESKEVYIGKTDEIEKEETKFKLESEMEGEARTEIESEERKETLEVEIIEKSGKIEVELEEAKEKIKDETKGEFDEFEKEYRIETDETVETGKEDLEFEKEYEIKTEKEYAIEMEETIETGKEDLEFEKEYGIEMEKEYGIETEETIETEKEDLRFEKEYGIEMEKEYGIETEETIETEKEDLEFEKEYGIETEIEYGVDTEERIGTEKEELESLKAKAEAEMEETEEVLKTEPAEVEKLQEMIEVEQKIEVKPEEEMKELRVDKTLEDELLGKEISTIEREEEDIEFHEEYEPVSADRKEEIVTEKREQISYIPVVQEQETKKEILITAAELQQRDSETLDIPEHEEGEKQEPVPEETIALYPEKAIDDSEFREMESDEMVISGEATLSEEELGLHVKESDDKDQLQFELEKEYKYEEIDICEKPLAHLSPEEVQESPVTIPEQEVLYVEEQDTAITLQEQESITEEHLLPTEDISKEIYVATKEEQITVDDIEQIALVKTEQQIKADDTTEETEFYTVTKEEDVTLEGVKDISPVEIDTKESLSKDGKEYDAGLYALTKEEQISIEDVKEISPVDKQLSLEEEETSATTKQEMFIVDQTEDVTTAKRDKVFDQPVLSEETYYVQEMTEKADSETVEETQFIQTSTIEMAEKYTGDIRYDTTRSTEEIYLVEEIQGGEIQETADKTDFAPPIYDAVDKETTELDIDSDAADATGELFLVEKTQEVGFQDTVGELQEISVETIDKGFEKEKEVLESEISRSEMYSDEQVKEDEVQETVERYEISGTVEEADEIILTERFDKTKSTEEIFFVEETQDSTVQDSDDKTYDISPTVTEIVEEPLRTDEKVEEKVMEDAEKLQRIISPYSEETEVSKIETVSFIQPPSEEVLVDEDQLEPTILRESKVSRDIFEQFGDDFKPIQKEVYLDKDESSDEEVKPKVRTLEIKLQDSDDDKYEVEEERLYPQEHTRKREIDLSPLETKEFTKVDKVELESSEIEKEIGEQEFDILEKQKIDKLELEQDDLLFSSAHPDETDTLSKDDIGDKISEDKMEISDQTGIKDESDEIELDKQFIEHATMIERYYTSAEITDFQREKVEEVSETAETIKSKRVSFEEEEKEEFVSAEMIISDIDQKEVDLIKEDVKEEDVEETVEQGKVIEKEESSMSDEDLVEKPSRISVGDSSEKDYKESYVDEKDIDEKEDSDVFREKEESDISKEGESVDKYQIERTLEQEREIEYFEKRDEIKYDETSVEKKDESESEMFDQLDEGKITHTVDEDESKILQTKVTRSVYEEETIDGPSLLEYSKTTIKQTESSEIGEEWSEVNDYLSSKSTKIVRVGEDDEDIISLSDDTSFFGRIESGLLSAADEEMNGKPVDFTASGLGDRVDSTQSDQIDQQGEVLTQAEKDEAETAQVIEIIEGDEEDKDFREEDAGICFEASQRDDYSQDDETKVLFESKSNVITETTEAYSVYREGQSIEYSYEAKQKDSTLESFERGKEFVTKKEYVSKEELPEISREPEIFVTRDVEIEMKKEPEIGIISEKIETEDTRIEKADIYEEAEIKEMEDEEEIAEVVEMSESALDRKEYKIETADIYEEAEIKEMGDEEEITKVVEMPESALDRKEYKIETEELDVEKPRETFIEQSIEHIESKLEESVDSLEMVTSATSDGFVDEDKIEVDEVEKVMKVEEEDMSSEEQQEENEEMFIDRTERFLVMPDTSVLSETKDSTDRLSVKDEQIEQDSQLSKDVSASAAIGLIDLQDTGQSGSGDALEEMDEQDLEEIRDEMAPVDDKKYLTDEKYTHAIHRDESSESFDGITYSRKLSSAEVDEFEHEMRREREEWEKIMQTESILERQTLTQIETIKHSEISTAEEKIEEHTKELFERRVEIEGGDGQIGTPQETEERPLSPSSYTLEADTEPDESKEFGSTELLQREEPEGRMSADISQQIFIEQDIESHRELEVLSESVQKGDVEIDEYETPALVVERPPSPSEFTLITSQDQDALTKALGLKAESKESVEQRQEEMLLGEGKQEIDVGDKHDGISTEHEDLEELHDKGYREASEPDGAEQDSTSSSGAILQTYDQSGENNTFSPLSSDNNEIITTGDTPATAEMPTPLPLQMERLAKEEGKRLISSYENVYEGVPLDPQINRLSLDASELDIGDRFDTKQSDTHLQTTDLASSYEQLYENEQSKQEVAVIVEEKSKPQEEDKLSTSSSEVAQVEDVVTKRDAEVRDITEEKTEETDVEEQFSPLPKHSPKPSLDLQLEPHKPSFSFTETPPESLSPSQHDDEISPPHESLDVHDIATIPVGVSPSDMLPKIMERSDESKESDMERSYEEAKLSGSTDYIALDKETCDKIEDYVEEVDEKLQSVEQSRDENIEFKQKITKVVEEQEICEQIYEEKEEYQQYGKTGEETDDQIFQEGEDEQISRSSEFTSAMAFENFGFTDEDVPKKKIPPSKIVECSDEISSLKLTKQISPEDLEEKPIQFDFDSELREELEQQQQMVREMEIQHEEFHLANYLIKQSTEKREESMLESKEDEKRIVEKELPKDFTDDQIPAEAGGEDLVDVEGYVLSEDEGEEAEREKSSENSSDNGEVFDEITGRFVPWEIQHQFRRQFSESYVSQEKTQLLQSAKSIDLGTFYRRDRDDDTQYENVTFTKTMDELQTVETDIAKPVQRKQVRFSFNDSDTDHQNELVDEVEEETLRFEQYYIKESPEQIIRYVDSATETDFSVESYKLQMLDSHEKELLSPSEPHNLISETHEQAVIDAILKSRMAVRVEQRDVSTATQEDDILMQVKRLSQISEASGGMMTSSYATACSSLETSVERSLIESHQFSDALSGEDLFAREDVNTETSLTPVRETPVDIMGVVSRESRLAQQELLQESSDEKDRSLSPSNESEELPTTYESQAEGHDRPEKSESKFTIAFPSFGKCLADNEIYESSETGDTTEEKLSPIEETPQDDFPEEQEEIKTEKKVTFQTDVQHLHSASSEDLVKTSTSSSEVSMEPTLLAASYDLDSGHVSHVVTAYDMSPDSVEKQFPVPATTKTILSSPEDDVFETDVGNLEDSKGFLMVSDTGKKIVSREKKSSSIESCPSPPAPTPKDPSAAVHETMPDLQGAAIKLQDELIDSSEDLTPQYEQSQDLTFVSDDKEFDIKAEPSAADDGSSDGLIEETGSPFEILSPVDIQEYDKYMEESSKTQMVTSFESVTTTTSSFSEIQSSDYMITSDQKSDLAASFDTIPLEPSAPPMPDVKSESSFEHSSPISSEPSEKGLGSPFDIPQISDSGILLPDLLQESATCGDQQALDLKGQKVHLPNGPTEVEYNPEIDIDYSEVDVSQIAAEMEQPDLIQSTSPTSSLGQVIEVDDQIVRSDDKLPEEFAVQQEVRSSDETQKENILYESTSVVTHEVIEELQVPAGHDQLVSSDQTLYGLDMPSEETGAMSVSISQLESSGRFDTEPESDSINVSGGLISQLDEDTSEKDLILTETDKEADSGLPQSQVETSTEAIEEKEVSLGFISSDIYETSPPEEVEAEFDLKSYEIYPGKRALEISDISQLDESQKDILKREAEMEIMTGTEAISPGSDTQDLMDLQDIQATQEDREILEIQEEEIDGCQIYRDQMYEDEEDQDAELDDVELEEMMGEKSVETKELSEDLEEGSYADKSNEELLDLMEREESSPDKIISSDNLRDAELSQLARTDGEEDDSPEKFELEVDVYDLERPVTPTPVDAKQQFFSENDTFFEEIKDICDDKETETEGGEIRESVSEEEKQETGELVVTASEFVETVLNEAFQRVKTEVTTPEEQIVEIHTSEDKTEELTPETNEEISATKEETEETLQEQSDISTRPDLKDTREERDSDSSFLDQTTETFAAPPRPTSQVLHKQISEDIPEITITQHLHKQRDEEDYPIYYVEDAKTPESVKEQQLEQLVDSETDIQDQVVEDSLTKTTTTYTEYTDTSKCIPEEEDEDDKPVEDLIKGETSSVQSSAVFSGRDFIDFTDSCVPEEEEEEEETSEVLTKSSTRPLTMTFPSKDTDEVDSSRKILLPSKKLDVDVSEQPHSSFDEQETRHMPDRIESQSDADSFLVKSDSDSASVFPSKEDDQTPEGDIKISEFLDSKQTGEIKAISESGVGDTKSDDTLDEKLRITDVKSEPSESVYQEDAGDSSSVDSFTTVVPANEEAYDEGEDRLEDFASMTSSFNSDIHGKVTEEEREKDMEGLLIEWEQKETVSAKSNKDDGADRKLKEITCDFEKDDEPPLIEWAQTESMEEMKIKHDAPLIDWTQRDVNGPGTEKRKDDIKLKHEDLRGIEEEKEDEEYNGGPLIDWGPREEEGSESSLESDRYEYIDKTALSVITEISDEDRFEMIDKEDLESEVMSDIMSDRPHSSPDYPPVPSPGMNNYKFFNKNSDKDDISVTSSLLEFERLEREIALSGSVGSLESADKDSLGGSMDEKIFKFNKSSERDDISITSSLAEFERLEREVAHSSSGGSVDKITPPDSRESGSMSSLAEFEKLEKDFVSETQERRSSSESFKKSETSSHSSLTEFERLEQELAIAEELEAEAQKIVSILESGKLIQEKHEITRSSFTETKSYTQETRTVKRTVEDDMDRDSIDGRDDQDLEDSLSEDKKLSKEDNLDQAEVDSLEGDISEITSMTSSVILAADVTGTQKDKDECDADSLHDESLMKTSADSLGDESLMKISGDSLGEELGLKPPKSDKFDTDSLTEQEGIMERSADSLEGDKKSSPSADKFETDSLHEQDMMQTSADSLESMELSQKYESVMESSMYSVASSSFSRSSQETMRSAGSHSDSSQDIMQVSTDSWEDKDFIMDNYHQQLDVESMTYDPSVCNVMGGPFLDYQGNVWRDMSQCNVDNYQWGSRILDYDQDETTTTSPYLSKGPYEEKKKIFTMAEWEAMKEEKRRASLAKITETTEDDKEESSKSKDDISQSQKSESSETHTSYSKSETFTRSHSVTTTSHSSTSKVTKSGTSQEPINKAFDPRRIASIDDDDIAEYDVTEHFELSRGIPEQLAQQKGPSYIEPGEGLQEYPESEEEDEENLGYGQSGETEGAEGGDYQSTKLMMKKQVHTKTVIKDGQEQTFIHEEAIVKQDTEPPEELRDSMQQIINQFMETEPDKEPQTMLEHDV